MSLEKPLSLPRRLLLDGRPGTSLRRQLSVVVSAGALLLALLSSLVGSWQASREIRETLLEQGEQVAGSLANQSTLALLSGSADNAADAVRATVAFPDVIGVELRTAEGKLLVSRGRIGGAALPAPDRTPARLAAETDDAWHFVAPVIARRALSPFEVGEPSDELLGDVRVVLGKETLRRMTARVFFANLVVSASVALLFLLAIRLLATRLTRPLSALSDVMTRAERGDREVLAEPAGTSDLARMAQAFNRMLGALRAREDELEQHRSRLEAAVAERTAQLQQAKERAEAANAAKSEFLARMSHELRTPLNAVLGYAQILQMDDGLSARQRGRVDQIHAGGEHLLNLIVDILDLSRIEAGRVELFPGPVRLDALLHGVRDIVRLKAEEKGIAFEIRTGEDLPAAVMVDEKRLRQVLINLLGNAVKFTDAGRVALTVGAQPAAMAGRVRLRFAIEDSGIGISPQAIERLFQPFEQAGDAQRRAAGTGLGLSISREFVRLMGGDIEVRSEPGRGSEFSFELELEPVREAAAEPAAHAYDGPCRRLLVADDLAMNRIMLGELLRPLGFEVHEANDGHEALSQVQALRPDLVLMDVRMPGLDGLAATAALRRDPATATLPVIMVSANAMPEDRRRGLAAGAVGFLAKPVDRAQLVALLTEHLGLRWRAPPAGES